MAKCRIGTEWASDWRSGAPCIRNLAAENASLRAGGWQRQENLPCRQERDFCRWRLARRKRLRDDISAQRPEIGDHHAREMAAKARFVLAGLNI